MAIRETMTVDIAEVTMTDDYRVELWQEKKLTAYTTQQARDLALELIEVAEKVDAAIAEDMNERGLRILKSQLLTESREAVL